MSTSNHALTRGGLLARNVALNLGFVHLPRFSQYYKTVFNEQPSQTLQRAKLR